MIYASNLGAQLLAAAIELREAETDSARAAKRYRRAKLAAYDLETQLKVLSLDRDIVIHVGDFVVTAKAGKTDLAQVIDWLN